MMDISLSLHKPTITPLYNNPADNGICQSRLHHLTTALHEKQFTTIGLTKTLNRFVAQKANRFSFNHYYHLIARYMEDRVIDEDENANPKVTEKFFIKSEYIFVINITNKKYDIIVSTALRDNKAYDSYFNKFNHFSLTFNFLTPKERDLHCSHEIMLRTKLTHTYTYYEFIQHHYITNTPSQNPQHRFTFINSNYTAYSAIRIP